MKMIFCLMLVMMSVGFAEGEKVEKVEKKAEEKVDAVRDIAQAYFVAITKGDVEGADAVVGVPYSLDGQKVLEKLEEVKALHKQVVGDKGERAVPELEVSRPKEFAKLKKEVFGEAYEVVRFTILAEGQHKGDKIDVYVKKVDGKLMVIGFSD